MASGCHTRAPNRACWSHLRPAGLSAKETAALEYADAFARIFRDRYPHRRPLYLAPLNEAGVRKLARAPLHSTLKDMHWLSS